jgi:hypothetical protein
VFDSWGACDIQQLMMVMVMVMVMVVMVMMMMMSPVLFRSPAAKEAPEAWDQNTSKYPAWLKGSKVQGCDMSYGYFMSFHIGFHLRQGRRVGGSIMRSSEVPGWWEPRYRSSQWF